MNLLREKKTLTGDVFLHFFTRRKYRIYRHLILILFLIASIWKESLPEPINTYAHVLLICLVLTLFYGNMYYLVPKFLFNDKFLQYCLAVIFIISVAVLGFGIAKYLLSAYMTQPYRNEIEALNLFSAMFILMILIASSTTIKLFQRWVIDNQRITELESITVQSELEQLKNQINPHFLFNTLNNANVLTKKDPEKASQVLMKLSDLLRYQLYDSTRDSVLLTADIHFLEDFLNLEKIRRDNFEMIISKAGELSGVQIAPLLFIIFVENAIKHNMDSEKESFIHLYFKVQDNELHFKCVNSKPGVKQANHDSGGLGLLNIKRRLELLYPKKHHLGIIDVDQSFTVNLLIIL